MNPITTYTDSTNKIAYILKKANDLGFYTEKNANNAPKLLHLLKSEVFSKFTGKKLEYDGKYNKVSKHDAKVK